MFYTRVAWVCLVCLLLCKEEGALVCVFVGFWDTDYVSQLPCVRYYVFVKSSFKHTREECESKRAYVFRCRYLVCQDLVSCYFCLLHLSCGECNVISLYVLCCSVNGSGFFCVAYLTVFVNCLVKEFSICLGVVVILLLNVMELFSVVG